jgi:Zn-dependent peptidase ImmA (M78 family)/DNA-binding XRE family transcriptional regulator
LIDDVDPTVLGANIAHARKRRQLTQAELAKLLAVSRPIVIAIEAGQRLPSDDEILRISEALEIGVHDLLSLNAPDVTLGVRFRSLKLDERAKRAIEVLEDYGRRYVALEQRANDRIARREPPVYPLKSVDNVERAADELAATERLRLGLGDGPLPDLRTVLEEDLGLRIFGLDELRKTRISGVFAYTKEYGALIGFNTAHDARRTRWTLCHELAHYLTERFDAEVTAVDAPPTRQEKREVFAEAFAARFLMPGTGLTRRFSEMVRDANGQFKVAHLLLLAHFFEVSVEGLTERLEELGCVTRGTYAMLVSRGLKTREAENILGIERRAPVDRLPSRYIFLVTTLYAKGDISEGDAANYLNTDRLHARQILQSITEARSDDEELGLESPIGVAR